jgi:bifunctional non-homologous end joining protein LigD
VRAVVGGYLPGEGGRAGTFGSLLLGLWEAGALRWVGSVGSGFGDAALAAIRETLDVLTIEESPFWSSADLPGNAVWVEPRLVALVQYKEFTGAGRLRAPSFKGFTDDDLATVTWENEGPGARS